MILKNNFIIEDCQYTSGILSLFAVFDGHGGKQCSNYCASFFGPILSINLTTVHSPTTAITNDMKQVFLKTISDLDEQCLLKCTDGSGSTACIILIDRMTGDVWCCNVGDSRCVFINNGCNDVQQFSTEHKPDFESERERIENANGWVNNGRVCGILSVSRSLGDKDFKQDVSNLIISTPDVNHYNILSSTMHTYLILACDGLFDVFTNEDTCSWMKSNVKIGNKNENEMEEEIELPFKSLAVLDELCAGIVSDAIQKRQSTDNVSVIIVRFDIKCDGNESVLEVEQESKSENVEIQNDVKCENIKIKEDYDQNSNCIQMENNNVENDG